MPDVPLQLCNLDASTIGQNVVGISPFGFDELGTVDDYERLLRRSSGSRLRCLLDDDVDACAEAEDEACVVSVEDKVSAGQQHLAGS
jgi:hypothetical protein